MSTLHTLAVGPVGAMLLQTGMGKARPPAEWAALLKEYADALPEEKVEPLLPAWVKPGQHCLSTAGDLAVVIAIVPETGTAALQVEKSRIAALLATEPNQVEIVSDFARWFPVDAEGKPVTP